MHTFGVILSLLCAVVVTRLDSNVNSLEGDEYAPVVSADGKTMLFCGQFRNDSIGKEDIYISRKTKDGWSKAKPIRELSTREMNEAPLALSADGTQMILFSGGWIYTSKKTAKGWSKKVPLPKSINQFEWQADAMITSDGKAMLFAAMKQLPYEDTVSINIFVSQLDEHGNWGEPIDLGPTINTPYSDRSPFLHPDMKTLYFSSDGHPTYGSMDIFMSKRLREDSWTEWSEPVNLGSEVNTTGMDCWYKISTDGELAYFTRFENDNFDLYSIQLPEEMRPTPVATITGKLTDIKGSPIVTELKWEDLEAHKQVGQSQTDPADGSFFIVLPEGKIYGYYIDDEKLFPIANSIDLRNKKEAIQIQNDITVVSMQQMIEEHIPMPLNNLFFRTNEAEIQPASIDELNRVVEILKQYPYQVEIGGHTDDVGSEEDNQILSEKRAWAVKNYLVQHGIAAGRLTIQGYGESRPVMSNTTAEGRRKNRRVEIRFTE